MTPLLLLLPSAIAAVCGFCLPCRARREAAVLAVAGSFASLIAAVLALLSTGTWAMTVAQFGDIAVRFQLRTSTLVAVLAIMVALVALAVQVYSVEYLKDDSLYVPYAAQVSLFVTAMMTVLLAGDLVTLLIGWELMGLCSYLLIGHYAHLPEAPRAAVKAFVVTRAGDAAFWLGIVVLALGADSFAIDDVLDGITQGAYSTTQLSLAAVLLLAGVAGKSAQFPLHTWLPDAMVGPTPISALIHAATMVAAGVYVLVLLGPLYAATTVGLWATAAIGCVTIVVGACAALVENDIKRVLAFSTMSQLGYMVAILGLTGTESVALFHLLTHAAMKALLFLSAGVLIAVIGSNFLYHAGGLTRRLPAVFVCTTIGLAALAGLPPLAGFWSKESILAAVDDHGTRGSFVAVVVWLAVPLTAAYAMRLWLFLFFGPSRQTRESPTAPLTKSRWMLWPIFGLTLATLVGGALAWTPLTFHGVGSESMTPHVGSGVLSTLLVIAGAFAVWMAWRRNPAEDPFRSTTFVFSLFRNGFYVDAAQRALVVTPVQGLARAVRQTDESAIAGTVQAVGHGAKLLGQRAMQQQRGLGRYLSYAGVGVLCLVVVGVLVGVNS